MSTDRKAVTKFAQMAATLVADVEGVEQASSHVVAAHKAQRFVGIERVHDLCCGIGGDAMSLVGVCDELVAVDHDALRAWMTRENADVTEWVVDVASIDPAGKYIHIDPARRRDAGRVWQLDDYEPGLEVLTRIWRDAAGSATKLGPGVDLDHPSLTADAEVEFISENGRLVQAVLWTGTLARATRSATMLPVGVTVRGQPCELDVASLRSFVVEVDDALHRAQLVGQVDALSDAGRLHAQMDLHTADEAVDSPWATCFEVVERMSWRPRHVEAWLREHDAGVVEVKTRGKAVNPDVVQVQMSGKGAKSYTLFVLRFGRQVDAIITRRR